MSDTHELYPFSSEFSFEPAPIVTGLHIVIFIIDGTDNVTDDNLRELTERQRVIIGMLSFDDTEDVTETTSTLAQKTGVSRRTIARDKDALKEKGFVIRIGPDNGGYWKRLK